MPGFVDTGTLTLQVRIDGPDRNASAPICSVERGGWHRQPDERASPSLLFLHSLGTDLRIWDGVVARLPDHTCLRLDLPGHGLSDVPDGDYGVAQIALGVLDVLEQLRVERAVLIGISVGGQIALRAALECPRHVAAVVALDTGARIGDRDTWEARMAAVRTGGLAAIADEVVGRWFAPATYARAAATVRGYRNLLLRTPVAGYLGTCAALRDEDLTMHLRHLTQRVLVACGSNDTATPPALNRALADGLPHGRYVEITDAGHLPCLDQAQAVAHTIDGFLRDRTLG